jgi:four helix bundle protein
LLSQEEAIPGDNGVAKTGFEKLRVYSLAEEIADLAWAVVSKWDRLPLDTLGKQLINPADSIGANIAEGTGRGSFADNRRFAKIAGASLFEVKHWLRRAYNRELLTETQIDLFQKLIEELTPKLSSYIRTHVKNGDQGSGQGAGRRKSAAYTVVCEHFEPTRNAAMGT